MARGNFFASDKPSSEIEAIARDAAVVTSLALQFGCPVEVIRHALTKDADGGPATLLDAAEIHERHGAAPEALEQRLADLKSLADARLAELQRAARERAEAIRRLVQERFPGPLGNIEDLEQEAEELVAEAGGLARQIVEELESEAPNLDDYDWPEPDEGFEDPLFDSTRGYVEQIDRYKKHKASRQRRGSVYSHGPRESMPFAENRFRQIATEKKYCSRLCYQRDRAEARSAGRRAKLRKQRLAELKGRKCAVCGGKIASLHPRAEYCSRKCASKGSRAKAARRN